MTKRNTLIIAALIFLTLGTREVPAQQPQVSGTYLYDLIAEEESRLEKAKAKFAGEKEKLDAEKQRDDLQASRIGPDFIAAASGTEQQLADSLDGLSKLREGIAAEKIPLSNKLSDLEGELVKVRLQYQQASRTLDSRTLDLNNLRAEINSRREEATYLSNLLGEYIRNLEARLHIAEMQRYRKALESAKLAPENPNLSRQQMYQAQIDLMNLSLERLEEALAGTRFKGSAVVPSGMVKPGMFLILGPIALFASDDGKDVGTAEQVLGSIEPAVIGFDNQADAAAAKDIVVSGDGDFPVDPTLGSAHRIEATKESLWEHIKKGGPVMGPILFLAAAAFGVALYKWFDMRSLRPPSAQRMNSLLLAVARYDYAAAMQEAVAIGGPAGKMLATGIEHIKEPRELIEEVMYETMVIARLKIQSLIPFIAMSASCAPLLGLLGTITGIINTFKLITVFGSGDVKTLSNGISEALITTEYGLIVAIPSLLLHGFLSRKAKGMLDQMEKAAVSFINQIAKTPYERANNVSGREAR